MSFDRTKTLAELDDAHGCDRLAGGEQEALIHKPLGELTVQDLCELIGQDVALEYLVPLTLDRLALDPLQSTKRASGYLLGSVLHCGGWQPCPTFWNDHPELEGQLVEILRRLDPLPRNLARDAALFLQDTPRDRSRRLVRDAERLGRLLPRRSRKKTPTHCDNGEPVSAVFRKVLELFSEAIQQDPTNPEAYMERGLVLYFQGMEEEAREDIRRALALGVEDPQKYTGLTMPLRGEEARAALQQGIDRCDTYTWDDPRLCPVVKHQLQCDYGHTYWREEDFRSCALYYESYLDTLEGLESLELVDEGHHHDFKASGVHTCCGFLSMCYEFLGDPVEAERALRRSMPYLDRLPWRSDEAQLLASRIIRLRAQGGDYPGALAACDEFAGWLVADDRGPWEALLAHLREAAVSTGEPSTPKVQEARTKRCVMLLHQVVRARRGRG